MFASKAKLDPRKWDKTSTIIEVKLFDQFGIKVDDLGRVAIRNRKFLRCFTPIIPQIPSSHPSSSPPSFPLTHYPTYQHTQSFSPPLHASPVPPPQISSPWGLGESATHLVAKKDAQQQPTTPVGTFKNPTRQQTSSPRGPAQPSRARLTQHGQSNQTVVRTIGVQQNPHE